jgi:hypothetical protein
MMRTRRRMMRSRRKVIRWKSRGRWYGERIVLLIVREWSKIERIELHDLMGLMLKMLINYVDSGKFHSGSPSIRLPLIAYVDL